MSSDNVPVPAATVVLLRDRPAFEVLMICRHESSSFAGGALVFPGGRVDPADRSEEWRGHAEGLADDPRIAAAQVAAIREAYEEVGVLLARDQSGALVSAGHALALSDWRVKVEHDDSLFLDLIRRERLRLACDALQLFSHWVAPPNLHKRFDTLFFAARFPDGQQVLEDGEEATEALWIAPRAALEARKSGARKIIFPTARNLDLLAVSASVGDVFEFATRRRIEPVMPQVAMREGRAYLTIPDGFGYPTIEEPLELAGRH
jgi:8-oxo-dGTP pyrophosphatase MutT (NUDIX family)